jgi:mono/diheme cytochrome c family protein
MVKKIFKWLGIVVASLLLIIIIFYAVVYFNMERRMNKTYSFTPSTITIPMDSASIAAGRHLVKIKGCSDCHGSNLAGATMINNFPLGRLSSRNLTRGEGGLAAGYSVNDWMRALEHGIDKNGKPLLFMPSQETTMMTKSDLASVIAYCSQVPPVNNRLPENRLGPVTRVMSFLGKMPLLSVEKIDHSKPLTEMVDTSNALAYGKYLSITCAGCHKPNLKGGESLAPGSPVVRDITSTGRVGTWSQEQFIHALRTGERPDGKPLDNESMPWKMTAHYSDKELASIYAYLKSVK